MRGTASWTPKSEDLRVYICIIKLSITKFDRRLHCRVQSSMPHAWRPSVLNSAPKKIHW